MKRKILTQFLFLLCFSLPGLSMAQTEFPYLAEIVSSKVNLRAGPNDNFERLSQLKKGDAVVAVENQYGWTKVKLPADADSFVNVKFVNVLGNDIGAISGNRVNIRASKGTNASILGQLKRGDLVRIVGQANDWFKIEPIDQSYGWILSQYLAFKSKEIPPPRVVQPPAKRSLIKAQKSAEEPVKKQDVPVAATGLVEDLGAKALSPDIRHKLIVNDKAVYFLQGTRSIIDGFLAIKVKVEGTVQPDIKGEYPVLQVKKITLVM